jgi:hypothetical protein
MVVAIIHRHDISVCKFKELSIFTLRVLVKPSSRQSINYYPSGSSMYGARLLRILFPWISSLAKSISQYISCSSDSFSFEISFVSRIILHPKQSTTNSCPFLRSLLEVPIFALTCKRKHQEASLCFLLGHFDQAEV